MEQEKNKNENQEIKQEEEKPKEEKKVEEELDNNYEKLPQDYKKYDFNYKIIIIGDSGVGKTCLMNYATKGKFINKVSPTLGFDYNPFFSQIQRKSA